MKATKVVKFVNTNQEEIDEYKSYIRSIDSNLLRIDNTIVLCKNIATELRLSENSVSNVHYRLKEMKRDHLQKIGELVSTGHDQKVEETIEQEPYDIYGQEFRTGDKVKLNQYSWKENFDVIKNPIGTIVFRGISISKYDNSAEVKLFVCFGDGKTIMVCPGDVIKIEPKKKKQKLTLIEGDKDDVQE